MINIKICKCGICEDDCEYHKPEISEDEVLTWDSVSDEWIVVPVTPGQEYSITIGSGGSGWTAPPGVTKVILTGCGGGGGNQ